MVFNTLAGAGLNGKIGCVVICSRRFGSMKHVDTKHTDYESASEDMLAWRKCEAFWRLAQTRRFVGECGGLQRVTCIKVVAVSFI